MTDVLDRDEHSKKNVDRKTLQMTAIKYRELNFYSLQFAYLNLGYVTKKIERYIYLFIQQEGGK